MHDMFLKYLPKWPFRFLSNLHGILGVEIMPRWMGNDVYPTKWAFREEACTWNEYKSALKYQVSVCEGKWENESVWVGDWLAKCRLFVVISDIWGSPGEWHHSKGNKPI